MTGLPCRLTARWSGDRPVAGEWLKAPHGRTAYEIIHTYPLDPQRNRGRYRLAIWVVRHPPSEIPEGATVHHWCWDKRNTKLRAAARRA